MVTTRRTSTTPATRLAATPPVDGAVPRHDHRRWVAIGRHYLEMLLAMLAGMAVLGTVRSLLGLTVPFVDQPGLGYLLMATDMAIGMVVWMRWRGCSWPMTLEMCAAMYVPLVLVPLVWAGLMAALTYMVVAHVVMMVAMLLVVVRHH